MGSDRDSGDSQTLRHSGETPQSEAQPKLSFTDLAGKPCKQQPAKGALPVLDNDPATAGCTFQSFPKAARGHLDVNSFYARESAHSVYTITNLWLGGFVAGSGVMVGKKSPSECLVLTDRHVVRGTQAQEDDIADKEEVYNLKNAKPEISVKATNGKNYKADEVGEDPSRDLALLSVHTGADTGSICKPAVIAADSEKSSIGTKALTISFPQDTTTAYLSIGQFKGTITLSGMNKRDGADIAAKEQAARPLIEDLLAARHASSGAARYNSRGHLTGIVDRHNDKTGHTFSTPISRSDIDWLLSKPPVFPQ